MIYVSRVAATSTVLRGPHVIIRRMPDDASRSESIKVRVIRDGREPRDEEWMATSVEERIEAVWTLTQLCLAWNEQLTREPRLQRTITRVQRAQR